MSNIKSGSNTLLVLGTYAPDTTDPSKFGTMTGCKVLFCETNSSLGTEINSEDLVYKAGLSTSITGGKPTEVTETVVNSIKHSISGEAYAVENGVTYAASEITQHEVRTWLETKSTHTVALIHRPQSFTGTVPTDIDALVALWAGTNGAAVDVVMDATVTAFDCPAAVSEYAKFTFTLSQSGDLKYIKVANI